ncbi:Putative zinc ribbon domain-containing protein [Flavobacterium omnivorum]|uniref:Putative zinc ribbon domain-containing protein n=1 Tax=Flavobacterium omnivorum TaxID=178355 RepID=A0A1G8ALT0_9FLAO|nr:zinc ribbon domain-containing protein [Flavobacterium omnivorum]SDH21726.1 Putative zinc ribbon domain-containing protein [Flavobacterium omnivorum]
MENKISCQSCSIPLDATALKGTDKNGLKSKEYCKYCFDGGTFKNPEMNLEQMKINLKNKLKKLAINEDSIQKMVNNLPLLKRWKSS